MKDWLIVIVKKDLKKELIKYLMSKVKLNGYCSRELGDYILIDFVMEESKTTKLSFHITSFRFFGGHYDKIIQIDRRGEI